MTEITGTEGNSPPAVKTRVPYWQMLLEGIADARAKIIHPPVYIDFSDNRCPVSVIEHIHFQAVIEELLEILDCITLSESHKNTRLLNSTFSFGKWQTLPIILVIQILKIWQLWKRSFCWKEMLGIAEELTSYFTLEKGICPSIHT